MMTRRARRGAGIELDSTSEMGRMAMQSCRPVSSRKMGVGAGIRSDWLAALVIFRARCRSSCFISATAEILPPGAQGGSPLSVKRAIQRLTATCSVAITIILVI
jgi:hypothetical protein